MYLVASWLLSLEATDTKISSEGTSEKMNKILAKHQNLEFQELIQPEELTRRFRSLASIFIRRKVLIVQTIIDMENLKPHTTFMKVN